MAQSCALRTGQINSRETNAPTSFYQHQQLPSVKRFVLRYEVFRSMGNKLCCFKDTESASSHYGTSAHREYVRLPTTTINPGTGKRTSSLNGSETKRKKSTKTFNVSVDCGSEKNDFDSDDAVSLYGALSRTYKTNAAIKGNNPQYMSHGKTSRSAPATFTYNIIVPQPGAFDVTLIFCETDKSCFRTGKRVFSVSVLGKDRLDWEDIDVFAKSGKNTPYVLKINHVSAESKISIVLRKGKAGDPFISGFSVRAAKLEEKVQSPLNLKEPNVSVRKENYDECIKQIGSYAYNLRRTSPTRLKVVPTVLQQNSIKLRNEPTFMFHEPETKVRGLIINFHGFGSTHHDFRIFNRYMYDQRFDIFNAVLAGHAYSEEHWPRTLLKDGQEVQETIEHNCDIKALLKEAEKCPSSLTEFFEKLERGSKSFSKIKTTSDYASYVDSKLLQDPDELFESTHMDYLGEALKQLELVSDYPGPIFLCGLSVGATVALALAAARPDRVKRVIAISPVFRIHEFVPGTKLPFVKYLGPLDMERKTHWDSENVLPLCTLSAANLFGQAVSGSVKNKRLFKGAICNMFMVLSEDDGLSDITASNDFFYDCGSQYSGHQYHIYPKTHRVPHMLLDPTRSSKGASNTSYEALYQSFFSYLTSGKINHSLLRENKLDNSIPRPPEAEEARTESYAKAFKTKRYSNLSFKSCV